MEEREIYIHDERIFLKKGIFGWNVIYPIKVDGKINWKNLLAGGNWWKLILVIGFVFISLGAIFEVKNLVDIVTQCKEIIKLPILN